MAAFVPLAAAALPSVISAAGNFFSGSPEKRKPVSTLTKEQKPLLTQAVNAATNPGAGGAFGESADYYRNLMSDNPDDLEKFSAPAMRQYSQDIVPGISAQFAQGGGGQGSFSSSGFRNAQMQGATDLAERLGSIRANLRQAGAQGLQNIGQVGLGNYSQMTTTDPGSVGAGPGLVENVGNAGTQLVADWFKNKTGNNVGGNSGPYGAGGPKASPTFSGSQNLPNRSF